MAKLRLKTSAILETNATEEYRFDLGFYVFPEADYMVAFCPSLDISTSGKDFNDAVKNFYERFQLYIETCMEMGTLWKDLMAHGWKVTETRITPPSDVNLLRTKEVNRILRSPKYEKMSASVRIPAM